MQIKISESCLFVTQYRPTVPNLKRLLMQKWHLTQQLPLHSEIFQDPPIVSYKRGRSLNDILFRVKSKVCHPPCYHEEVMKSFRFSVQ